MATPDTQLIISIETILKNLDRTLKGLSRVESQLRRIASIRPSGQEQQRQQASSFNRTADAAERLRIRQERLVVQSRELANRQERARQASERLRLSQERLTRAQANLAQAGAKLGAQQDAHVRAFRAIERAAGQFNRNLIAVGNSLRSVGQGFASFGATLSIAVSAPLAALGVTIVNAAVQMDSLRRGLTTIAGSAELASVQLARLTEIAKLPGIGFQEAIQGSIALQAVGFSANEAEKALIQFSNAVALTGGSREQLQTITVQLGQMAAQSKVLAADLKPIINAAPAVAVALRNAFGTVRSEEIQELGIQSKDFIDIMVRELGKLPRAAAGARNSFDNFRDSVFRAAATIGGSLLPALVRLADTFGPILTGLANAFAALPVPIQSLVLTVGALGIALGPMTFIFGQLVTGLGRVVVGFAQLNALGLLPTIANFRLLGRVMIGTASLAQGTAATAAAAAAGWATLGVAIIAVIGVAAAIATLSTRTKEHVETTEDQIRATEASLKILRAQQKVLSTVTKETEAVAGVSDELNTIYKSLNKESQGRVEELRREVGMTEALRREIGRLITAREGEQAVQAVTLAASVTDTAQQIQSLGQQLDVAISRIERLRKARESLAKTGRLPRDVADPLLSSIASVDTARQLEQIDSKIKELSSERLPELRQQSDEATASLAKQSDQLQQLEQATGKSTREILEQAKSYGLFKGDVDIAAQGIENFRKAQVSLQAALTGTTEELIRQRLELRKLSAPADEAQKQRRLLIDSAIDFARENSNTIDEAKKKLDEFAEKFPEVRKAIEDELKKRPIEEFLREITGQRKAGRGRSETSIRNAQEALAKALAEIAQASADQLAEIEQAKNNRLLQQNESNFQLQLIAYRQYLNERARLTSRNLQLEIDQQQRVVDAAQAERARFQRRLGQRLPPAERAKVRAGEAQAEEKVIRAQTRINELQERQRGITDELRQALAESAQQQLDDIRQLEIEYAELQGRIQDALNAQVVEQFRKRLKELTNAQEDLNLRLQLARETRDADTAEEIQRAKERNQREIDSITNQIRLRDGLAALAAAEQLVTNAKERQRLLEEQINFEVQFRGLSEEEAIRRRLEGERRLQQSLQLSRSIITDTIRQLTDLGITPPPELQKFVENLAREIQGLGELPFSEQFRLAEKEFNRLNDERLRRIADVERAVRNRDIAEAEGRILIKKINGEHVADLEAQLELLKRIAELSGQETLKRQAADTGEVVKDAKDKLADFGKQLRATSIDSFRDSFVQFFSDLRDQTTSAAEDFIAFLDRISARITEMIAENLGDKLLESIFGTRGKEGGILAAISRLFGLGGEGEAGAADIAAGGVKGATAGAAATTLATGATTAAAALTTGGATAGTAMSTGGIAAGASLSTGGVTASATLVSAITGAAAAFSAAVIAAGAAFAAAVAAAAASQAATGIAGSFASGDFLPAKPGGRIVKVAEAGHAEAVLTTDPRYAARQARILTRFLKETRGLAGRFRVPELAEGAFISPRQAEMNLLNSIDRQPLRLSRIPETAIAAPDRARNIRFIFLDDQRQIRNWMNSPEGDEVFVEKVVRNAPLIRRIK